jgi:hypothetical protein
MLDCGSDRVVSVGGTIDPSSSQETATMIPIMMLVVIGWYAGWRISKEDWSGQSCASISSTTTINERW